jgi:hypothetical protein
MEIEHLKQALAQYDSSASSKEAKSTIVIGDTSTFTASTTAERSTTAATTENSTTTESFTAAESSVSSRPFDSTENCAQSSISAEGSTLTSATAPPQSAAIVRKQNSLFSMLKIVSMSREEFHKQQEEQAIGRSESLQSNAHRKRASSKENTSSASSSAEKGKKPKHHRNCSLERWKQIQKYVLFFYFKNLYNIFHISHIGNFLLLI